jgi:signal transduction histidine kinase
LPQVAAGRLQNLVDTRVQMRGVMTRTEAGGPLLLVPGLAYLEASDPPPEDAFQIPAIATSAVKAFQNSAGPAHRVKVAGVVTCRRDDLLFVQDAAGGVCIRSAEVPAVAVGDQVEAVGFPQAGVPAGMLVNGQVKKTGGGVLQAPVPVTVAQLADGKHEAVVVQLKATVLDQRFAPGDQVLELQAGERFFQATLPALPDRLPEIPAGSVVQVAGVCWGAMAAPIENDALPKTFKLFLRSPADVALLQRPPWWTWKHTAGLVGGLVFILAAALFWIRQLHQRVAARTRELEAAMVRLNQETQTSATLAERERLAAEIHDGLQQGLSGIMLQLEGAAAKLFENPNFVRSSLDMARNMVVFCLSEVRHSVLNLQSPLVTEAGLGAALTHVGRQMSAGRTHEIRVEISGAVRPLPPAVEHHLFRIGQEALNNAIKHAKAGHITVELNYAEDSVRLAVKDDGCGFVVADVMGAGGEHLGVRSLRGRARKLGGRLTINSQSGRGTTVEVIVPAGAPPPPPV